VGRSESKTSIAVSCSSGVIVFPELSKTKTSITRSGLSVTRRRKKGRFNKIFTYKKRGVLLFIR
jgi:hypothetical protein